MQGSIEHLKLLTFLGYFVAGLHLKLLTLVGQADYEDSAKLMHVRLKLLTFLGYFVARRSPWRVSR